MPAKSRNPNGFAVQGYVNDRRHALEGLNTQHFIGKLEVDVSGRSASVRASSIIFPCLDQRVFNPHARYQWEMTRTGDWAWLISSTKYTVVWNEGDSAIHSGAKASEDSRGAA